MPNRSLTLDEEKELEIKERLRKKRLKEGKIDLKKVSVPDALKIMADKRAHLFSEKTKQFSLELERMILSIDENQLIQYIREEMAKKELLIDTNNPKP